ncbi:UNVERIFIED_CONTAM: Deoxyuridine 5'-triphosphate nucleotidohydrolase [Sesamum radiatum]|uniref:Deoxyuridine 5'-triphosphate nucleotidohydrolase n=1 Tax=Sesamum radiatum TaxID=300843 RepID=A0AAW2M4F6_SESRA
MAGTNWAPFSSSIPGIFPPFNRPCNSFSALNPSAVANSFKPISPNLFLAPKMAQAADNQDHSPEIKEPSAKIAKLTQNGDCENKDHEIPPFLRVKKLLEKAILPSRGSPLSAGYDLSSAAETKVPARGKALIPTDLSIAIPEGTYARVGVIDADYRGPVGVILFNHSDVDFEVKSGDRIAQLIIEKVVTPEVTEVDDLDSTHRGSAGFGSTGV